MRVLHTLGVVRNGGFFTEMGRELLMLFSRNVWLGLMATLAITMASNTPASAQNPRGTATGPTTARGYDHPDQFMHLKDVKPTENMYPVIAHPEQEKQAETSWQRWSGERAKSPTS